MGIGKYIKSKIETAQEQRQASIDEQKRLKKIEAKVQTKEEEKLEKEAKKLRTTKAVQRGKEKAQRGGVTKRVATKIKKGAKITAEGAKKMGERLDEKSSKFATPQEFGELFSVTPIKTEKKTPKKKAKKPKKTSKKKPRKAKKSKKTKQKPENMWF